MAMRVRAVMRWKAVATTAAVVAGLLVAVPLPAAHALAAGDIDTVVGGGVSPPNGAEALSANITPWSTALNAAGDLFFVDTGRYEVDVVPAASGTQFGIAMTAGHVYTIAGNGVNGNPSFTASGVVATSVALSESTQGNGFQIALDSASNVFVTESRLDYSTDPATDAAWVQEIANTAGTHFGQAMTAGFIYTVAGNGVGGQSGLTGPATAASFRGPNNGIAVDAQGNLLITSSGDHEVFEVPVADGTHFGVAMTANHLYVVAGNGTAGAAANGSGARSASLNDPSMVAVNASGDLMISEWNVTTGTNALVREVPATTKTMFGILMTANDIYTVAGGAASPVDAYDAVSATSVRLYGNPRITFDSAGNLIFTTGGNSTQIPDTEVYEIAAAAHSDFGTAMTAGFMYSIAGNGTWGFSGDGGPARSAQLKNPSFTAVDGQHDVFVSDAFNGRIREITGAATSAVVIAGTVRYQNGSQTPGVPHVLVQACSSTTQLCSAAAAETSNDGSYSITVPGPDTYVVTAYPEPASVSIALKSGATAPLAVGAAGRSGVDFLLAPEKPFSSKVTIKGQTGTIPTLYWGSTTPFTVQGCADGTGFVVVTGLNDYTAEPALAYVNLVETTAGSGIYETQIPPMSPVHGNVEMQYYIDCSPPTALVPGSGPVAGGTTVDVNGTGFTGAKAVMFGTKPAPSFTVLSDTELSAVAPPGSGSVGVSVTTPSGSVASAALATYNYIAVTGVSPASAKAGATVTITGAGLSGADALFFGMTPATDWSIESDTTITATVPAGAGGVDVVVQTGDGGETAATAAGRFGYSAASAGFRPADGGPLGSIVANGAAKWQSAANYIAKFVNIAVDSCAGSNSLKDAINNGVQKELAEMRQNPTGIVDASITGLGAGGASYLGTGLLVSAGIIDAAAFAPAVATIALILAVPATLQALQAAANNPNLDKCLKKLFPKPPKPPKPPKKCKGKKCSPAPQGGSGSGKVDPSGTIEDTNGNPIEGATVTLLRSVSIGGPFTAPATGSPLMEPSTNPETTDADGIFHWDVVGGYYQVQATKSGCTEPGNAAQPTVTTETFSIPPPVLGIVVAMSCTGQPAAPMPAVTGLYSPNGPAVGGNRVSITGTGFTPTASVAFGGTSATAVSVLSPTTIQATAPAGTGTVDVVVTTGAGASPIVPADAYTYRAPVTLQTVSPASGPANGGTVVTLTGAGFAAGSTVLFGSTPASSAVVSSAGTIKALAPGGAKGTVGIRVVAPGGTSAVKPFAYSAAASTTRVRASANPVRGHARVTFTATVAAKHGGSTPTGQVAFKVNGVTRCAHANLNQRSPDTATCVLSFAGGTTQHVTAVYLGDSRFASSTSAAQSEKVRKQSTSTALHAAVHPIKSGGARVTLTATVAAKGGGRPTGKVTFTVKGAATKSCVAVRLSKHGRDRATCTVRLSRGTYRAQAHYTGSSGYLTSTSKKRRVTAR